MYHAKFEDAYKNGFEKLEEGLKKRVRKKVIRILEYPHKRHLHKSLFFVDEIGQYRLTYRVFEETDEVRFYFVGTHKEYEAWYLAQF